jgi:leucyl-tRNA synthetase
MFDWRHELSTTDPAYYKWTQWLFLQLFKAGLAYKKRAAVNWCPKDKTVLANEQVINGRCERCDTPVEQRLLDQWFFRITDYAERLLRNLDTLDWSESTLALQRNWIGRSEGAEITFETPAGKPIVVFTTRPDTIFGATGVLLAPEHPLVYALTTAGSAPRFAPTSARCSRRTSSPQRSGSERTKTGVFLGLRLAPPPVSYSSGRPTTTVDYDAPSVWAPTGATSSSRRRSASPHARWFAWRESRCPPSPRTVC